MEKVDLDHRYIFIRTVKESEEDIAFVKTIKERDPSRPYAYPKNKTFERWCMFFYRSGLCWRCRIVQIEIGNNDDIRVRCGLCAACFRALIPEKEQHKLGKGKRVLPEIIHRATKVIASVIKKIGT